MDMAQHSPGKNLLHSVQLGDLPGNGMTIIDGIVRTQRRRNTPPATRVPEIVGHYHSRAGNHPAAFYSITSSAPLMSEVENASPSILAAFRLMKSSTFVTSWTGRSEGFSPLRIHPA
jgi:hypothetical protein